MPPLPANHKALLDCRRLRLSLKRIQEVQQQVIRIRNPIRTKDNRHVHQLCCAGCFPLTCRAVGKGNSSREDGVNNHQSSSAYLAHTHHLQVVTTCTPARSCRFRVACSSAPRTMAGKPPCAFCSLEVVVPLCAFCRNIWTLGVIAFAHILYYVIEHFTNSDK